MVTVLVLALVAVVSLYYLFFLTGSIIGLVLTVVMAAVVGYIAQYVVRNNRPYGFLGSALTGVLGCWLGVFLIGKVGPVIFGIPILSALVGAVIVTFVYAFISREAYKRH